MAANSSKNHQESSKMSNPRPKEIDDDDDAREKDNCYLTMEEPDYERSLVRLCHVPGAGGPITIHIPKDIVLSAAGGMTYSLVANSLVNNRRGSATATTAGLSDIRSKSNENNKRTQDSPSTSNLKIDTISDSLLGNKDDSPPPPKLAKDNLNLNSGSRMQATTNSSTYGFNATITNNDIGSLAIAATPSASGSTNTKDEEKNSSNNNNNVIEKIGTKSKKTQSPVVIYPHITILSLVKEGQPPTVQYQCNVCSKKFRTRAHIKYHEFCPIGEKKPKPFNCKTCGRGFISKSHYQYHLRIHTGERPYLCEKCGKRFNQKGKLTRHLRTHRGEKPFVCQTQRCGRGFANAQALGAHNLIHTGERPYPCKFCNKRFTGMTNLKKHLITHTGERPFKCLHCEKRFGLKWTLVLHLRTHSNERPHVCDECPRAFSNSKDLRRHLVIHSEKRPFKCWVCTATFKRKDNLDRHIKLHYRLSQLANEAADEYLASQKEKAPNHTPTTTLSNQNLNKSSSLSSIEEEAVRLVNDTDTTPPDNLTTCIENGQLSMYVKTEAPDIENYCEPESASATAINKDGEMTENGKVKGQEASTFEEMSTTEGQGTLILKEISTTTTGGQSQETSTLEKISTTAVEQVSPSGELEIDDQINEMMQVDENKNKVDEIRENSSSPAEGNSQEGGVVFEMKNRTRNSLKIGSNKYGEINSVVILEEISTTKEQISPIGELEIEIHNHQINEMMQVDEIVENSISPAEGNSQFEMKNRTRNSLKIGSNKYGENNSVVILEEISTTKEQISPSGELENHDQINEMIQVGEIVENSSSPAEGNSQEGGVVFEIELEDRVRNSLKIGSNKSIKKGQNNSILTPKHVVEVEVEEEPTLILYANAAAKASSSGADGIKKVTLLHAEVFGVKGTGSSVDPPRQYMYTSAKPNQEFLVSSESQSHVVQMSCPKFYTEREWRSEKIFIDFERNSSPSSVARSSASSSASSSCSSFSISISSSSNHSDSATSVVNASTTDTDIQVKTDGNGTACAVHVNRSLRSAFNTMNILAHLKSTH